MFEFGEVDWHVWAEISAVVGAGIVALKWLWKYIPRLYHKVRYNMFGIGEIKADIGELREVVKFVANELRPNGGASVRDSLNRIELRQVLQEQRQKAILSDMSVGVFETDNEGLFIWVNRKYLRMTGRAPSEVSGTGWINTVAERDRERVWEEWTHAVQEAREFESRFLLITPEGGRKEVCVRTYKMSNDLNEPLGFIGMVTPGEDADPYM